MPAKALRPIGGLELHAWAQDQDTALQTVDGECGFYLERPVTAGRLDSDWNYRLSVGDPTHEKTTLITIRREGDRTKGVTSQVIHLYGPGQECIASLHWYGATKKRMNGKESGTKKFLFDWQGRELVWDSKQTFTGIDHYCSDLGSGEILCYFRATFLPLQRDGKILISPRIKDETTRTMLVASCVAYREWASRRETGVYLK